MALAYVASLTITSDVAQLASTQTNFPLYFAGGVAAMRTVGSDPTNGKVQLTTGVDVKFYSDSGLTSLLDYELVAGTYVPSTGVGEWHIRIPSCSIGTVIYVGIGDAGASDQSNPNGVWDTNYKQVWHLPDGTTLTAADSTSNANTGVITGSPAATTGQIDGGAVFGGHSGDRILSGLTAHATQRTYELWANRSGTGGGGLGRLFDKRNGGSQVEVLYFTTGVYRYERQWSGANGAWTIVEPGTGAWHLIQVTYDATNTTTGAAPVICLDGVSVTVTTATGISGTPTNNTDAYIYGNRGANDRNWAGSLDECRISNTIRSTDWALATYNNQKASSTFLTLGSFSATATAVVGPTKLSQQGRWDYRPFPFRPGSLPQLF